MKNQIEFLFADCPSPPNPPSGGSFVGVNVLPGFPISPGSIATYECDPGYQADDGSPTAICLDTGEWDGPEVICRRSNQTFL